MSDPETPVSVYVEIPQQFCGNGIDPVPVLPEICEICHQQEGKHNEGIFLRSMGTWNSRLVCPGAFFKRTYDEESMK